MRGPQFESSEAEKEALVTGYEISRELVDELFDAIEEGSDSLIAEYDLEKEVDVRVVEEYLKIAFTEDVGLFIDDGVWGDPNDDMQRVIDDMDDYSRVNLQMMVGRVASRHEDMVDLSGAILQDAHGRE